MSLLDDLRVDIGDDGGTAPSGSIASLHNLLSSTHPDTIPSLPQNGAVIVADGAFWKLLPSGEEGEVLSIGAGSVAWGPVPSHSSVLFWGNNRIGSSTTTRYLNPSATRNLAGTSAIQYVIPRSGIIQNMSVVHNSPAGNGNNIVYTLRVNSVSTPLSVSISSTGILSSDTLNTVVVDEGDLLDVEVTKISPIGSSPSDIIATMEFI